MGSEVRDRGRGAARESGVGALRARGSVGSEVRAWVMGTSGGVMQSAAFQGLGAPDGAFGVLRKPGAWYWGPRRGSGGHLDGRQRRGESSGLRWGPREHASQTGEQVSGLGIHVV